MPLEPEDEADAVAQAFDHGRSARRRRAARAPKRMRTWRSSTVGTVGAGGAATQTATRPVPSLENVREAPAMMLADFIDGL